QTKASERSREDPTAFQSCHNPSILPEILEALWAQFGIPNRVLNVLVPEVELNCPSVLASVRQIEAGCVTEHMGMHGKLDASRLRYGRDQVMHVDLCHRTASFGSEDIGAEALFSLPGVK